ncbi:hypothetical protein AKJ09_05588 [Labilithrix luteola]|uniref:Uncharacterized protein n=1 Tax=Labilithrix luteola TaxID=1391654 RepID=A0A0K1Q0I1_9BACT|nr:YeeE/YedE family protein [Labilithrix luteola]AKU98924.1 hypothetical protein AKJ09_05588 [Labilithrix luteola]
MSSSKNARLVMASIAGVIFGVGLGVAGMTRPSKVLAFLDVAGAWDPSLAFVMIGAIGVHMIAVAVARRRSAPLLAPAFSWPTRTRIDMPLLAGAALFGVGWGLGGFCPGPALTTAASGNLAAIAFVLAMVGGMTMRHLQTRPTKRS